MPTALYASVEELKARIERKDADTTRDEELEARLQAASRAVEQDTGRDQFSLDDTATVRTFRPQGRIVRERDGERIFIDDVGSGEDLTVEIGYAGSGSWTAVSDWETGPDNAIVKGWAVGSLLRLGGCWVTSPLTRIRVTARWGWPAVPPGIHDATLIWAHRLYRRRGTPEGVAGFSDMGVVRLSKYDADYQKLIDPFVLPGFGG